MEEQMVGGRCGEVGGLYHDPLAIEVFERFVCWSCHLAVVVKRWIVGSRNGEIGTGRKIRWSIDGIEVRAWHHG